MVIHPKLLLDVLLVRQRKESPMDHGQLSMVADKFQWVFSETLLNTCGKDTKFCRRQRTITPFRLGLALTATCASHRVETLADCHRGFNALFDTTITYKAFYDQLAKPHFATFMGTMASRLIGELTLKVLGFAKGRAFAEFRHIVIQDGSAFAIHDALREVFPGRFKTVKPAAVELHTTMDLLCDAPTTVVLTPDTTNEQAFLPEPAALRGSLLLADRGYLDLHYMRRVQDAGGFFLIRAKAGMNPQVVEAFREDGTRLRALRNKPLKTIHAKLPKRQRVELVVTWQVEASTLRLRLLISWNRRTQEFCYLVTNLPAKRYHLDMLYRAYKWRWQVEVCQTQPIKMTWCPLRLFRLTRSSLRGGGKREYELDVHRFSRYDDFADQALGDGLTFCKRELGQILAQQLAKGLGIVHHLLPMDALLPRLRQLATFLGNLVQLCREFLTPCLQLLEIENLGLIGIE